MSNLQILIENIQTAISFPETISPDLIKQYARDYAEACAELNRQIQNCIIHIRNGNNAEAVRLAEMERPNIPSKFLQLDFAERNEWVEIVSTLGYSIPPALSAEQAKELENAYLQVSPLEPLLKSYRLQSLNNSPLKDRLATLRLIAKTDSQNLFWHEDQERFEKVRIGELNKEVGAAVESKNNALITSLYQELNSADWQISPPLHLRQALCVSILQNQVDVLLDFFADFNYPQAVQVYASIQKILVANSISMPQHLQTTMRSAVKWLNETQKQNELQKIFNRRSSELKQALDAENPKPVLENLYYQLNNTASQAGLRIAKELDELYHCRIDEINLRSLRIVKIIIVAIISACIMIGSLITWGLVNQHNKRQLNNVIANLQKIEADKKIDEIINAIKRIEKDMPRIAKAPEVVEIFLRLQNILQEDECGQKILNVAIRRRRQV
ncbi:MAG: hypothetical protein LBP59_06310 [Planctomycetaceae bacterium]|jgi:hypothetical protein|nr:hypothetical protein [Planctomycetaceae bacterium]